MVSRYIVELLNPSETAMNKRIWMAAGAVITALTFLAFYPEVAVDTGRRVFASTNEFDPVAWLSDTRQAAEAGDPYAQMNYGHLLLHGSGRWVGFEDHAVAAEPERGRLLMQSAADRGLTQSLYMLWWRTGRNDEALLHKAADLGDPGAITEELKRQLETAECTPEGRAAFDSRRPTPEQLNDGRSRARTFLATYPPPDAWEPGFSQSWEREYDKVEEYLEKDLVAIGCAAKGTPIPDAASGA